MSSAAEHIATDQPPGDARARDLDYGWQAGNQVQLLENGEAYFPRVFDAMRSAQREILLETEQGMLMIRGNELHVNRLTLDKGEVDIDGRIDSFVSPAVAASVLAKVKKD